MSALEDNNMDEAIRSAQQHMNLEEFRNHQRDVIECYLQGKDVLFCSPTGSGKSRTFEIAPLVFKNLNASTRATVIVVSPLVALMTKQTEKCSSIGLKSVYLKGKHDSNPCDMEEEELVEVMDHDIQSGEADIIFASPETILESQRNLVQDLTKKGFLKAIFIDEAHCIAKYGKTKKHEKRRQAFRPAYGKHGELRALAPGIPVVALTTTATKSTRDIIIHEMCLYGCKQIILSPNKTNIKYWQIATNGIVWEDFIWLVCFIRKHGRNTPRMLIYFRKIKQLGDVFDFLRTELKSDGFANNEANEVHDYKSRLTDMFHNKTDPEVKKQVCHSFMDPKGIKRVVLCSTSFSMGLDLQGVESIVHYGPANDVEDYIQETGRAGRDSQSTAHAVLMKFKHCLSGRRNITDQMKEYLKTKTCRRVELLKSFDENPKPLYPKHNCCDNYALSCMYLCECPSTCTCEVSCSNNKCDIIDSYKSCLDSSDELSGSEEECYTTSSDSDIATGTRCGHITLSYTSEED